MFEAELNVIAVKRKAKRIVWLSVFSLVLIISANLLYVIPAAYYPVSKIRSIWTFQLISYVFLIVAILLLIFNLVRILSVTRCYRYIWLNIALVISLITVFLVYADVVYRINSFGTHGAVFRF